MDLRQPQLALADLLDHADFERRMGCPDHLIARGLEERVEEAMASERRLAKCKRKRDKLANEIEKLKEEVAEATARADDAEFKITIIEQRIEDFIDTIEETKARADAITRLRAETTSEAAAK